MGDPQLRSKHDHVNSSSLLKGYKRHAILLMKSLAKATAHPVLEIYDSVALDLQGTQRALAAIPTG